MNCTSAPYLSVAIVGDIHLGSGPSISVGPDVAAILQQADFALGNMEGPITDCTEGIRTKICLIEFRKSNASGMPIYGA